MPNKLDTPWKCVPSIWKSESAFWSWCKGNIRKAWSRHPVKVEYIKQKRVMIDNPKPKGKAKIWGCQCEHCNVLFPLSNIEVDHKYTTATLTKKEDIQSCVEKLWYVTFDDLQLLCKDCHRVKTYVQLHDVSVAEARMVLLINDYMKLPKQKLLAMFKEHGYTEKEVSNDTKRKAVLRKIIEKEKP